MRRLIEKYMKAMLSRAQNLKVLHSGSSVNVMLRTLEGSSILPGSLVRAPFEEISENIFSEIKLECMSLHYTGPEFNFNRITPMLLKQCCTTTIRFMDLDAVLAVPLMCYGIHLENVKNIWMTIDYDHLERFEPRILNIVKNFDFTGIFPDLNKVQIVPHHQVRHLSPDHMNAIIEGANTVLGEPMVDRAVRVKELNLRTGPSSTATQLYLELFPNIEKLEIEAYDGGQVPFWSFWNWLELKELKVIAYQLPADHNLDSVFCGIFPEEVAELRLKDDDYLRRVNIVPIMPALTCLKSD